MIVMQICNVTVFATSILFRSTTRYYYCCLFS